MFMVKPFLSYSALNDCDPISVNHFEFAVIKFRKTAVPGISGVGIAHDWFNFTKLSNLLAISR